MRIVFGHEIFSSQAFGGISRYFVELAIAMRRIEGVELDIFAPLHVNKPLASSPDFHRGKLLIPIEKGVRKLIRSTNSYLFDHWSRRETFDLLHQTYYAARQSKKAKARVVVTVYDMIHELFPEYYGSGNKTARNKARSVNAADMILCISESTKNDLLNILGTDPEKVRVTHLGYRKTEYRSSNEYEHTRWTRPFLLYVGSRIGYKNFDTFLRAYASSPHLLGDFSLICFGGGPFSRKEEDSFQRLKINRSRVQQLGGGDRLLMTLYSHATALVYPSLYEGFGLPILEAMSQGCPVICSNTSSLPEVAQEAAEYFSPFSVDDIRSRLHEVLYSSDRLTRSRRRGFAQCEQFTWKKTAAATLDAYSQVL